MKREPAPALAKKLAKLGLRSSQDLALHLPHRYEDETRLTAPELAPAGKPVLVEARLERAELAYRPKRQLVVHAEGLVLRFLNFYGSQLKALQRAAEEGLLVRAYGEVRPGFFGAEMVHPRYRVVPVGEPLAQALTPVYPTTAGLSQYALRKLVLEALDEALLEDTLPEPLRQRHALAGIAESIRALHRPAPDASTAELTERGGEAWRRVKFDELLAQQLSMRMAYRARRSRNALALPSSGPLLKRFLGKLPFRLTRAQSRAMAEILRDLAQPHPMQRLLQGDVGSGKTIVAAIGCLVAIDAGCQAAVLAPTEILAEQHLRKFSEWLGPLGVPIAWLHGGLTAAEKKAVLKRLQSPTPVLAIGTHALFQKKVAFSRLALAIVDEQHRFGVEQRLALRRKGEISSAETGSAQTPSRSTPPAPHQLMMSATPIPRTLSMSYFADLDVSTIDELPPGRRSVATRLAANGRRAEVLQRIREACAEGQQAYWVCPVIEESKTGELQTALDTFESLRLELKNLRVGLLHGRLPAAEKAQTMQAFSEGKIQLLVATTVIEVGVDVPNASLMVIEHAERFGLAQLHQLRGRIGRASGATARESVCILLYAAPLSASARARLRAIFETRDGFEIARQDLLQRGPGEVLGQRQSGVPLLRYADLEKDASLALEAREAARRLLDEEPQVARHHVERWLASRHENAQV
ncbi:MAG: ATP-dependent DNA helicase RecG [Betaproteobacteria bacterium]|nr:ATP-dependent DNA helicase RecG [Betaproteobacteria bacterium]